MVRRHLPTSGILIGCLWIAFSGVMLFLAALDIFFSALTDDMFRPNPNIPTFFKIFPPYVLIQIPIATAGLIAAVNFLKLKAWGRTALEVTTWVALLAIAGFIISHVTLSVLKPSPYNVWKVIASNVPIASYCYCVLLIIILRYLRGNTIRSAVAGGTKGSPGPRMGTTAPQAENAAFAQSSQSGSMVFKLIPPSGRLVIMKNVLIAVTIVTSFLPIAMIFLRIADISVSYLISICWLFLMTFTITLCRKMKRARLLLLLIPVALGPLLFSMAFMLVLTYGHPFTW